MLNMLETPLRRIDQDIRETKSRIHVAEGEERAQLVERLRKLRALRDIAEDIATYPGARAA